MKKCSASVSGTPQYTLGFELPATTCKRMSIARQAHEDFSGTPHFTLRFETFFNEFQETQFVLPLRGTQDASQNCVMESFRKLISSSSCSSRKRKNGRGFSVGSCAPTTHAAASRLCGHSAQTQPFCLLGCVLCCSVFPSKKLQKRQVRRN